MNTVFLSQKAKKYLLSALTGAVNALFGAGGGVIAVKLFSLQQEEQKKAQASAVCMILPLSAVSALFYYLRGHIDMSVALPYLPFGVLGACVGPLLLKKLPSGLLKKLFALFMIYTGLRMIMR